MWLPGCLRVDGKSIARMPTCELQVWTYKKNDIMGVVISIGEKDLPIGKSSFYVEI